MFHQGRVFRGYLASRSEFRARFIAIGSLFFLRRVVQRRTKLPRDCRLRGP